MSFVFFLHTSYVLLSSFPVCNQWKVLLNLVNVQRKNTPELMNDGICAPARFLCRSAGDCTWSIALELHAILVGNVADWSFHIMGSSAVFKCQNTKNTAPTLGAYHCIYMLF